MKIIEYDNDKSYDFSLSLDEVSKDWDVKVIKKNGKAEISNYKGTSGSLKVPAFIDGIPIYKVGKISSFPEAINEVTLPSTVETLTDKTFKGCSNLSKLVICRDTEIPFGTFDKCDSLTDSNGCVVVGGVLHYLTVSENVVISEGVKVIPDYFEDHSSSENGKIKSIKFPESLVRIGKKAFSGNKKLSKIVFPPNLREIDDCAFEACHRLKSITFNEGLEKLHGFNYCFRNTNDPLDVVVPDSVKDFNAFNCTKISRIILPYGIKEIPAKCFEGCDYLSKIELPESVIKIGDKAFAGCSFLNVVSIPTSVKEIGTDAFKGCGRAHISYRYTKNAISFKSNTFSDCVDLTDENGFQIFNGVLIKYRGSEEVVTVPGNIDVIGNKAFKDNKSIKAIAFNNPDIIIGEDNNMEAFKGCDGLADENGFVIVNNCLYDYVGSSKDVVIPSNVEHVATGCFTKDNVSSVYVPKTVKSLGNSAFEKEVEVKFETSVPFLDNRWFGPAWDIMITQEWCKEKMPDGFYIIDDCLVYCEKTDATLEIPSGVRSIARDAVKGRLSRISYDTIILPEGLEYVAPNAFGDFKNLYLPKSIKKVGSLSVENANIFIHEGVDPKLILDDFKPGFVIKIFKDGEEKNNKPSEFVVGKMKDGGVRIKAYNGPTGRDVNLVIPSHIEGKPVKSIGKEAFYGKEFSRIELPDTVEAIEKGAFELTKLDFIKLPSNLKMIDTEAFYSITFSYIDLPDTVEIIKLAAINSLVAVVRGNPDIYNSNNIKKLYSSGNLTKNYSYAYPDRQINKDISDLDKKYEEYKYCGVIKRGSDGRTIEL